MLTLGEIGLSAYAIHALAVLLLGYLVCSVNWATLRQYPATHHFLYASVIVLAGFWLMKAGIYPGLHFHILGVAAITLLMGWRLAILVYAAVLALMVVAGQIALQDWSVSLLLGAMLPVWFCYQFYVQVYRRLPHNPFVYILVAGFLNAAVSQLFYIMTLSGWYLVTGTYTCEIVWANYLSYLILALFPEGVINGMFISGMVIFHPRWLSTFDEDSYFSQ